MPESVSDEVPALRRAESLMRCGSFALAVEVLQRVDEWEPNLQALCLLSYAHLELGEYETALRYALVAAEGEPSSAPAGALLATVNTAFGRYPSALSDFVTVADLVASRIRYRRIIIQFQRTSPCTILNSLTTF